MTETPFHQIKMMTGRVYEITPLFQISYNGLPPIGTYYAKCIGINSKGQPVFEKEGRYFSETDETAIITEVSA